MLQRILSLSFALLLLFFFQAKAQKDTSNIIHAHKYNCGTYYSFSDMYHNRPGNGDFYKAMPKSSDEFVLKDTVSGKELEDVYGYCDGKYIYLNRSVYNDHNSHWPESNRKRYVKILEVGRYLFFLDGVTSKYGNLLSGAPGAGMIVAAATYTPGGVIDTKTGEITLLSEKKFKKILSEYPDILDRYNKLPSAAQTIETKQTIIKLINAKQKQN